MKNAGMPEPGEVRISMGALSAGCEWPTLHLAVLTEGQLTGTVRKRAKLKKETSRQKIQSYTDLSPGDLVVHVHHGVGRFAGIQRMPVDGVEKDYIKIDYAGGDCLYVPVTQLDLGQQVYRRRARTRSGPGSTSWAARSGPSRRPGRRRLPRTWRRG